jgi:hypothetical protein
MFRKLVANLPFSPSLVGQLGFYAKRLRAEETTRRIGLIFTALALIMQSFAVLSPPEAANAAHPSDMIYGGVSSVADILSVYDASARGNGDFKKIMDYAGVTRAELAATKSTEINSWEYGHDSNTNVWLTWGRISYMSAAMGEVKHDISGTTLYSKPFWRYDTGSWSSKHGSNYPAFRGYSAKIGHFAIQKNCGNLLTTKVPPKVPPAPKTISVCRPGTGVITIKESEKKATDLPANSDACKPKPAAFADCSSIQVRKIGRTQVELTGNAVVKNGATIKGYQFTVRSGSPSGKVVAEKSTTTTASTSKSGTLDLKTSGTYYANVVVKTSLGDKTSSDCATPTAVEAEQKCVLNPTLPQSDKACQPCPGDSTVWYKDDSCKAQLFSEKSAKNLTQDGVSASTTTAQASDRIQFTLSLTNKGTAPSTVTFSENLRDVLEYATIQDNGGGTLNSDSKVLSWGDVKLNPGQKTERTFVVKVMDTIPTTSRGISEPASFDCLMTNTFGNTVTVKVDCATPKVLEASVEQLPSTGPGENMLFAGILASVVVFFYARSRQMSTEVRLIRKEFNMGTL